MKNFELPDGSYSVSDEYINKKHETLTNNAPKQIYINRIENSIICKIKLGYYLELLAPETIKLLGRLDRRITTGDKNDENIPQQ